MASRKMLPPTYLLIAILMMVLLGFFFPILRVIPPVLESVGIDPDSGGNND